MSDLHLKKEAPPEDKSKRLRLLLITAGALAGILLLLLGGGFFSGNEDTKEGDTEYLPSEDEMLLYQEHLEERIRSLCLSVKGVENVTAIVSLSKGFSSLYATEWKDGNEEYVILGSGANAAPLFLARAAPEIEGIGIVCRGGGSDEIRRQLTGLLCATFHLSSNRIYITEAK